MIVGAKTTARFLGVICGELVTPDQYRIRRDIPSSHFLSLPHEQDGRLRIQGNRDAWGEAY